MAILRLSNSPLLALIDDEDIGKTQGTSWRITNNGYIRANIYIKGTGRLNKRNNWVSLHRYVLDLSRNDPCVDHINGDKLDNRKSNLRLCTLSQNSQNTKPRGKTGLKGVSKTKQGTYRARININKKESWLGVFSSAEEAAAAFDQAALKHHGEFAYLNFPQEKTL